MHGTRNRWEVVDTSKTVMIRQEPRNVHSPQKSNVVVKWNHKHQTQKAASRNNLHQRRTSRRDARLCKTFTYNSTPSTMPFTPMAIAAILISPTFRQPFPVVFWAILISLKQKLGHIHRFDVSRPHGK